MQAEATPQRAPISRSWRATVIVRRTPVAASGWPSAMAPPLTLSRISSPSSRPTASVCAPWASLISKRAMSSSFRPLRSSSRRIAGAGPMPMISGGTPTTAAAASRASGARPHARHRAALATSAAAAASVSAELLPPVCTPSLNTVRSLASTSGGVGRGWVSRSATVGLAGQADAARLVAGQLERLAGHRARSRRPTSPAWAATARAKDWRQRRPPPRA
jgi:hypothetical protein